MEGQPSGLLSERKIVVPYLLVTPAQLMRPDIVCHVAILSQAPPCFHYLQYGGEAGEFVFNYPLCAWCQGRKDDLIVSGYAGSEQDKEMCQVAYSMYITTRHTHAQ